MKYEVKKPQAKDLFVLGKMLRVIGFKNIVKTINNDEDIKQAKSDLKGKELTDNKARSVGILVVASLADSILENLDKIENDLYQFISNLTDLKVNEIKTLNIVDFAEVVMSIFEMPDYVDFIKVVLKSSK